MPRSLVIRQVAYRGGATGIVTGILLAIARMTGETAPLIFTALGNSLFTADPRRPMSSLPLIIYEFARSPYAEQQKLAWTGALIVTARRAGPQHRRARAVRLARRRTNETNRSTNEPSA